MPSPLCSLLPRENKKQQIKHNIFFVKVKRYLSIMPRVRGLPTMGFDDVCCQDKDHTVTNFIKN